MQPGAAPRKLDEVALFRAFPDLAGRIPWVRLGDWPTPVEELRLGGGAPVWVKREDRSSRRYGGNKVRTLEAVLGRAAASGAPRIWAIGAYGSNHALATVTHAPAAGMRAGIAVFPQPLTVAARANLSAILAARPAVALMRTPLEVPLSMALLRRRHPADHVMAPGGATPPGTFGALSAALELAEQVAAGQLPAPERIVLAVGSTCTTAGVLVGLCVAERMGIGFGAAAPRPRVHAVRVTPWPVTSAGLILSLAWRAARLLESLVGPIARIGVDELARGLVVDGSQLGGGYGRITARGWRSAERFRAAGGPPLDVVYTAKSAAALLELQPGARGPLLYWASKSSAPIGHASDDDLAAAPARLRRWLAA
ncbi:MAG TPA: pyridoxal-phosphate dependent enzyme [Kofleriaceae bacterium]|nr:pyridoxal-phosphate dependent enzyme [Kofleriaceae bacterium]